MLLIIRAHKIKTHIPISKKRFIYLDSFILNFNPVKSRHGIKILYQKKYAPEANCFNSPQVRKNEL